MQGLKTALARVRIPVRSLSAKHPILHCESIGASSTHRSQQLLQLQNTILPFSTSSIPQFFSQPFQFLGNSSSVSSIVSESMSQQQSEPTDPNINKILDFWFKEKGMKYWFQAPDPAAFDAEITEKFKSLVETARETDQLDHWTSTPQGALALVILLDQFPRNIYRLPHDDAHLSFASDEKALQVTTLAVAHELDKQIGEDPSFGRMYQIFFYVPFMHAEDLLAQVAGVSLYENMHAHCEENGEEAAEFVKNSVEFSKKHLRCIKAIGRFPKRNEALNREHREIDKKWLEEHPQGF